MLNLRGLNVGQSFTAFGPAAADDVPSSGSSHTGAETVGTGPFNLTGLICTFHENSPCTRDMNVSIYWLTHVPSRGWRA